MKFSFREIFIIIDIGLLSFMVNACGFMQDPLYPSEALKKGLSATEYSVVFGCYQFACFIFTPIFGKITTNNSLKQFFTFAAVAYSISTFSFGFLTFINGFWIFISLSCLLRVLEGMGAACVAITATAIGISLFPNRASLVIATLEVCYGGGMIIGSTVGVILYTIGGFFLPFACVGVACTMITITAYFVIPSISEETVEHNKGISSKCLPSRNMFELMKITWIFINSLVVASLGIADSFLNTLLEEHLNKSFGVSVQNVGYLIALSGVSYSISGFLCGYLIHRYPIHKQINLFGCFMILACYTVMGPAPYYPFEGNVTLAILGMVLFGIGNGFINVATFTSILLSAIKTGHPDDLSTYAQVSCLWFTCIYFGYFIGPLVAGVLYDNIGFSNSSLFVILIFIIVVLIIVIEWIRNIGSNSYFHPQQRPSLQSFRLEEKKT